jgi:RimJ/RimL family protein N-acetyltransferase
MFRTSLGVEMKPGAGTRQRPKDTPRVQPISLVRPDTATLDALPEGWTEFPDALRATRDAVAANPAGEPWGSRLFMLGDEVVGWGGFKGPPEGGVVEVGYEVAPDWQRRGLATAAVAALIEEAFAAPEVDAVVAHTLAEPGPSPRVLEKNGFARDGEGPKGSWRFRLRRGAAAG